MSDDTWIDRDAGEVRVRVLPVSLGVAATKRPVPTPS